MSAASATQQFSPGKVENLRLSPHPHPVSVQQPSAGSMDKVGHAGAAPCPAATVMERLY